MNLHNEVLFQLRSKYKIFCSSTCELAGCWSMFAISFCDPWLD